MDKYQAVINFLMDCPPIRDNKLFFNFINAEDNSKQVVTDGNDKIMQKPFIDGSVQKRYTFTIIDFKSVAYRAIAKQAGYPDENVEEILQVQDIIDWITAQADNKNFPDFGEDCHIDSMEALTENPNLNGVDTSITPALAKYSIAIRIEYIDYSKRIWK